MKRWFFSYSYKLERILDEVHFGSTITEGEHPILKIARWNKEMDYRTHVLLFYRELEPDEVFGGSFDVEI